MSTGLEVHTETEDFREGGINDYVHKIAKETKYPNLTLKRGITDATGLWDWYKEVVAGTIQRKTVSVILSRSPTQGEMALDFLRRVSGEMVREAI